MDVIIVPVKINCSLWVYHPHLVCQQLSLNHSIKES